MSVDLRWSDLPEERVSELVALHAEPEAQQKLLAASLALEFYEEDERERIILDFLFNALRFGIDASFSGEQISVLVSIMKTVLYRARDFLSARGVWPSMPECFESFKALVIQHSFVTDAGAGCIVFTKANVAALTAYATDTLFRHFSLYKAVFTREQDVEPIVKCVVVETPLRVPALASATQQ